MFWVNWVLSVSIAWYKTYLNRFIVEVDAANIYCMLSDLNDSQTEPFSWWLWQFLSRYKLIAPALRGVLFWHWGGFPLCNGVEQGEELWDFTITGLTDSRLLRPKKFGFNYSTCSGTRSVSPFGFSGANRGEWERTPRRCYCFYTWWFKWCFQELFKVKTDGENGSFSFISVCSVHPARLQQFWGRLSQKRWELWG